MTVLPPLPVEIVTRADRLDAAVKAMLGCREIALDTESNSFFRYPEQLCLIQIATRDKVYIIDTIVLKEIAPLEAVLADAAIGKVVHGADYDIRSLDRHYGFRIRGLFDTGIAARLAGATKFGLAALIEDLLQLTIPKSKQLQRADWGRRPLSAEALDYAASDVRHLFTLQEILTGRLQSFTGEGRTEWAAEEFCRLEEIKYVPPDPETAYLSVKGAGDLDGRGLAILRSIFLFREGEAMRQHRPHFYIVPDAELISLAMNPGEAGRQRIGPGLEKALREGLAAPPVLRPAFVEYERMTQEQFQRLSRLKAWRISMGADLSLDPSLLWPMSSLERLARAPNTLDAEMTSAGIRRWQRDRFAAALGACLELP